MLSVNGQPFIILSIAGIEVARLKISLEVALTLITLEIPILKEGFSSLFILILIFP
ncbi:DUF3956 domain-containing protein [Bacillus cereus]|nr:DUF3956 domain-containing protein [Bacillus cereus]